MIIEQAFSCAAEADRHFLTQALVKQAADNTKTMTDAPQNAILNWVLAQQGKLRRRLVVSDAS